MTTERFFYLLTEDGEVLLSEDGQPFFGVEIIEEEVSRSAPFRPKRPQRYSADVLEEDETILMMLSLL